MTFIDKLKWVLGILLVFILIVATNLIDRHNYNRIHDTVVSIYEDRLIASDLILGISRLVKEKEMALYRSDSVFYRTQNQRLNEEISELLAEYDQTRLTLKEEKVYADLKSDLDELRKEEEDFRQSEFRNRSGLVRIFASLDHNLSELSGIQVSEGSRQMGISQRAIDSIEMFTQLEIYMLLFLALVIQVIVMYKPKEKHTE